MQLLSRDLHRPVLAACQLTSLKMTVLNLTAYFGFSTSSIMSAIQKLIVVREIYYAHRRFAPCRLVNIDGSIEVR